jgi:hypothetical protein
MATGCFKAFLIFMGSLVYGLCSKLAFCSGKLVTIDCPNVMNLSFVGWIRFAALAGRMENLIQGNSRDVVDQAYMKLVICMQISYYTDTYLPY